jgi:uncharacterized repeat protein (TIGR01451 family)
MLALLAALALPLLAAAPALATSATPTTTPQFDRCLAQNGLSAPPADQAGLAVQTCKTVRVTKITTYAWTLTKTPSPGAITLAPGQSALVDYTLAATATPTVRWVVDGEVVVRNVGSANADITRVTDTLRLAGGASTSSVLSANGFTLGPASAGCPCVCPPEKSLHYSFSLDRPPASGTNTAATTWSGAASGSSSFTAPVDFSDGPATNRAVYLRTATLSDAYAAPPAGLLVGVPANPGPFTLSADQPQSLLVTLTSRIRNESLACPAGASVADTATLASANKPEETNNPTSSGRPPAVSLTAAAAVQVTAGCAATETQTPPGAPVPTTQGLTPATAPQVAVAFTPAPGGLPVAPVAMIAGDVPDAAAVKPAQPSAAPVCTRPSLVASIVGPRRVRAGQQVAWRISVRNAGSHLARSVVLNDRIPIGFSLLRSTPRVSFVAGVARFHLPNLRPGQTATVRLTMRASRDTAGRRLQQARIVSGCGGIESAVAPITVTAVAGVVTPAVTG